MTSAASARTCRRTAGRDAGGGRGLRWRAPKGHGRRSAGSRRRRRAGWRPTSRRSSPASRWPRSRSTAGRAAAPSRSAAASATSPTASSAPRRSASASRPIPWAYRVFFRQIGLDPDRDRTPVEQLVLDRLQDGGFRSRGLPGRRADDRDVETGVALRAFDADRLEGGLCIRDAAPGESLPGRAGRAGQRDADDRRRGRPGRRSSSAPPGRAARSSATAAGSRSPRSASGRCPRSRSRRRYGLPPRPSRRLRICLCRICSTGSADRSSRRGQRFEASTSAGARAELRRADRPARAGARRRWSPRASAGSSCRTGSGPPAPPRVLDLGELEEVRDALADAGRRAHARARRARRGRGPPTASCSRPCSPPPSELPLGARSAAPTSACPAAATGTRAPSSARSGC